MQWECLAGTEIEPMTENSEKWNYAVSACQNNQYVTIMGEITDSQSKLFKVGQITLIINTKLDWFT